MGLIILYFLGALSLSFLCSVLEAVLLSTPMSFISMKENQGSKTASLMKQYKNNVDRPVGAILSLNTIAHTIGSAGVGAESIKLFGEEYFGIISAILTLLILVLSEIIPKTIGASYWRWQCHPPRLSGYSSSSPTLWYCSQNLSQRYSRLRATRLP